MMQLDSEACQVATPLPSYEAVGAPQYSRRTAAALTTGPVPSPHCFVNKMPNVRSLGAGRGHGKGWLRRSKVRAGVWLPPAPPESE